jgi:hypothetical protein
MRRLLVACERWRERIPKSIGGVSRYRLHLHDAHLVTATVLLEMGQLVEAEMHHEKARAALHSTSHTNINSSGNIINVSISSHIHTQADMHAQINNTTDPSIVTNDPRSAASGQPSQWDNAALT